MSENFDWEKFLAEWNLPENREKRCIETCAREGYLMLCERDKEIASSLRMALGLVDVMAFSDDLKYSALRRHVSAICDSIERGGKISKN